MTKMSSLRTRASLLESKLRWDEFSPGQTFVQDIESDPLNYDICPELASRKLPHVYIPIYCVATKHYQNG
jgi:hypothetical protein